MNSRTVNRPQSESDADFKARQGANLPHWTTKNGVYSVTFRTADSLPASKLQQLRDERDEALSKLVQPQSPLETERVEKLFSEKVETFLDSGDGTCPMREVRIAAMIVDALKHFSDERYDLLAWAVMPNHVHAVVAPRESNELADILHSWKSYSAKEANRILLRSGEFWQAESYDRLIRSEAELSNTVKYVTENPTAANLSKWEWFGSDEKAIEKVLRGKRVFTGEGAILRPVVHGRDAHATFTPHKKSFEYVKTRLGLSLCEAGKLDELLLGSPFDYATQSRLYVPSFLPEPGMREKDFTEKFSTMVAELAIAAGGRAMVLYTSYAALEASARLMRPMLAPENIELLQQGQDGSREALLERLKENGRSVLLGTASFWEGVDVRGEALSLLVIAKLPFAVFTDPIVQGRCELLEAAGKDAFLHYSIPNAILKLRQGFGRLIRSKGDRGLVVLADKRVLTKRYGAAFLRALPAKAVTATNAPQLVEGLRNFLEKSQD